MSLRESSESAVITRGLGKSIELVEQLRNKNSANNLFAGIFNGDPPFDSVFADWPKPSPEELRKKDKLVRELTEFLIAEVDPYLIDETGSVPLQIFETMSKLGLYGIKVPEKWGGKGLSQTSYVEALSVAASWCSAIVIVLSADNTIGCKFPVMYYGTDAQKDYFLPELVKGPTGFCLTEPNVGSDASKIRTYAVRLRDDEKNVTGYEISGEKWFTTNGILSDGKCLAKYLAVVMRIVDHPDELDDKSKKPCFGLFIVPTSNDGVDIGTRNYFVGMRGIHNSNPKFNRVRVPAFNLIGEKQASWESEYGWGEREGSGLQIAFESLNTGRIAIAQGCVAISKQALNLSRWWAAKRNQFDGPLQDKELISNMLVYAATNILTMEAMTKYACISFDSGQDVRIEAAAAKTFAAERAWQIVDNLMQIRGGRGYETWQSLSRRELTPPDEIIWTGARPNRIFEGANEIMVQFIFREGADKYIKAGLPLMSKSSSLGDKLGAILKMAGYYLGTFVPNLRSLPKIHGRLLAHVEYVNLKSRKLAEKIISKSAKYRSKLAVKQLMLDRFSRIAINLGAMTLASAFAEKLDKEDGVRKSNYVELADLFCRATKVEVDALFWALDHNDDDYRYRVSKRLIAGDFDDFLLGGIIPMTEAHMRGPKN